MEGVFTKEPIIWNQRRKIFTTIQQAVTQACPGDTIYLSEGRYYERVRIRTDGITLVGIGEVIIQWDCAATETTEDGEPIGTFATPTVVINANDVTLSNITIANRAERCGRLGQAIALYIEGNHVVIEDCSLLGFQDTLCLGPLPPTNKDGSVMVSPFRQRIIPEQQRYFYRCHIEGTIDFIFGGGNAVFQDCHLHCKNHLQGPNFVTAPSTAPHEQGFIFETCDVTGESQYYLARPWRPYAKVRWTRCHFDARLDAKKWDYWGSIAHQNTVQFLIEE